MTDVSCIVACALPFDERIRCIAQKNTNTSNIVYLFRNLAGIYIEIYIYLGSSWFHHGSSLVPAGSKWFLLGPAGYEGVGPTVWLGGSWLCGCYLRAHIPVSCFGVWAQTWAMALVWRWCQGGRDRGQGLAW